jgi:hypothetical protein
MGQLEECGLNIHKNLCDTDFILYYYSISAEKILSEEITYQVWNKNTLAL